MSEGVVYLVMFLLVFWVIALKLEIAALKKNTPEPSKAPKPRQEPVKSGSTIPTWRID